MQTNKIFIGCIYYAYYENFPEYALGGCRNARDIPLRKSVIENLTKYPEIQKCFVKKADRKINEMLKESGLPNLCIPSETNNLPATYFFKSNYDEHICDKEKILIDLKCRTKEDLNSPELLANASIEIYLKELGKNANLQTIVRKYNRDKSPNDDFLLREEVLDLSAQVNAFKRKYKEENINPITAPPNGFIFVDEEFMKKYPIDDNQDRIVFR